MVCLTYRSCLKMLNNIWGSSWISFLPVLSALCPWGGQDVALRAPQQGLLVGWEKQPMRSFCFVPNFHLHTNSCKRNFLALASLHHDISVSSVDNLLLCLLVRHYSLFISSFSFGTVLHTLSMSLHYHHGGGINNRLWADFKNSCRPKYCNIVAWSCFCDKRLALFD